jgi:hypothetical protein
VEIIGDVQRGSPEKWLPMTVCPYLTAEFRFNLLCLKPEFLEVGSVLSKYGKVVLAVLVIAAMFMMVGCPTHASIADISQDPGRYAGKDISIRGSVSDSFGALGNGVFQIDDGTGRMWVYSQNFGVPGNGNKVEVVGRVEQGFALAGRSFGVILRETEAHH